MTAITKMHTTVNFTKKKITPKFIVVHDTGVPGQTDEGNGKYFQYTYRGASAHKFVDENSITEVVPDGLVAWHVGDDKDDSDGINNYNTLGIELTAEYDKTFNQATLDNAKQVIQNWMKKYNIPANRVVRHYDASGKNCPQFMNRDGKWTLWKQYHKFFTDEEVEVVNSSNSKALEVTVKAGDTLWGLSKQYNATVAQLKEWNGLKSDVIVIGDKLTVGKAVNKPTDNPVKEKETKFAQLKIDGSFGPNTATRLQQVLGTQVTGIIGGQYRQSITENMACVQFGKGGSMVVRAMQRKLDEDDDGYFGPKTLKALQRRMGTPVTGAISKSNSAVVKALQRRLNDNRF